MKKLSSKSLLAASSLMLFVACSTQVDAPGSVPRDAVGAAGGACGNGAPLTAAQLADVPRMACTDRPARVNGCGPNPGAPNAAAINKLLATPPVSLFSALFNAACNAHDGCWGRCYDGRNDKADKKVCDDAFLAGMKTACAGLSPRSVRVACKLGARAFWSAVAFGGAGAWTSAQAYHCAPKGADGGVATVIVDAGRVTAVDAAASSLANASPTIDESDCPIDTDSCTVGSTSDDGDLCMARIVGSGPDADDATVDLSTCMPSPCSDARDLASLESCVDAEDDGSIAP